MVNCLPAYTARNAMAHIALEEAMKTRSGDAEETALEAIASWETSPSSAIKNRIKIECSDFWVSFSSNFSILRESLQNFREK